MILKKSLLFVLHVLIFTAAFPIAVSADMGPKASVVIDFDGIGIYGETYYVTLLSSVDSTGPYSALSFHQKRSPGIADEEWYFGDEKDYPIYLKFLEYQDDDGYYFLRYFQNCSATNRFIWGYHPPSNFKILLYFPEKESYMVSAQSYERYAFDSYFAASINDEVQTGTYYKRGMEVIKSYDYSGEIISLVARIILTVIIELIVAIFFAFRGKKELLFILAVNAATQIILNTALNLINFHYGQMIFVFAYLLLELLVFIFEAVIYTVFLRKFSNESSVTKWKPAIYALVANTASFIVGLWLANIIPGIF